MSIYSVVYQFVSYFMNGAPENVIELATLVLSCYVFGIFFVLPISWVFRGRRK